MKALKILIGVLIVLGLLLAGLVFLAQRLVERPEFRQQLVSLASKATGTTVELAEIKVSLFSGIELRGVAIGNPPGFPGKFLTARAFVLRYRLWPLLWKRIEVKTLVFDEPVITLAKNAKEEWNYEKLGTPTEKVKPTGPADTPTTSTGGLDLTVQNIEMKNAEVIMLKEGGKELLRIRGASFASAVQMAGGQMSGAGRATIELVNAGNSLLVRNVAAPVAITPTAVTLAPLTGKLAGGDVSGDAGLSLTGDSKYTANLRVTDADVVTMLKEAGVNKAVFTGGKLQMTMALTGTGGMETINGSGHTEIVGGQLVNIPLLNLVATLLQVPVLQDLKFDEFKVEFTMATNVMLTPVVSLKAPLAQITGSGAVALADYSLDHTLTLTLAASALERAPKEVRNVFTKLENGSFALEFKVWGPYDSPKTDLQRRLAAGVGGQLLEQGLKRLLK